MKKRTKIFLGIMILATALVITITQFYKKEYRNTGIEEMLFYMKLGLGGANFSIVGEFLKAKLLPVILIFVVASIPIILLVKANFSKVRLISIIYSVVLLCGSIVYSYYRIGMDDYIQTVVQHSDFIQEEYVDPKEVKIQFPEKKRNLIVIYLESLETTMFSTEVLGGWDYTVMPELEAIAKENINFSNTDALGGARRVSGSTWTIGALVGTTSGLPLKVPVEAEDYTSETFLMGATALGDVLRNEGYNLKFMFGSDANFGGRRQYFTKHGEYEIFDLFTAIDENLMTEEEEVFWGFEDEKLFEWAKVELKELAEKDEPFNFNLLTVNTHFPDGWIEEKAEDKYETQYENVHAYSSQQVAEFLEWLKEQDFYENTTVVLTGDHNSMQEVDYYEGKIVDENFERVTYNAFINTPVKPVKEKNRNFSNYDMFPTLLGSIGAKIEGNRLGLGVDLFSDEQTTFEKYGIEYVNEELKKNSNFYNYYILGNEPELVKENLINN